MTDRRADVLAGRRALVTGSGQGVGEGIARALAAAGAVVLVNDVLAERADAVVEGIRSDGGEAAAAVFDVTDHDAVLAAVAAAGGADVLVNNAGNAGQQAWSTLVPFVESGPADWEPFLAVNLHGVLHCTRAVLPGMVERGWGRVVTILSDSARVGEPGLAAYGAAKAGAAGLTRAIAAEVGRHGVTANCVSLGTMVTPATEEFWREGDPGHRRGILQRYAIRRPGETDDVTGLVTFLCSPAASWITGQTYPVNGGSSFSL